jgi:hypothetical protein
MAKNSSKTRRRDTAQTVKPGSSVRRWIPAVAILVVAGAIAVALLVSRASRTNSSSKVVPAAPTSAPAVIPEKTASASDLVTMDVAKAVMVTVELDFGPKIPSIAEALAQVERRYQPDDGQGRTFAVLDAYGEPTPDGKLHMSMHVSSEKPGGGQLIFKKNGEVLWRGKINPTSQPVQPKTLTVLLDNGKGTTMTVDGSGQPNSIIDAKVKPGDLPVRDIWPDGQERELTFIYSACGCPVKLFARRVGDRTMRVSDTPVIFPDDPAAVTTIAQLMKW